MRQTERWDPCSAAAAELAAAVRKRRDEAIAGTSGEKLPPPEGASLAPELCRHGPEKSAGPPGRSACGSEARPGKS